MQKYFNKNKVVGFTKVINKLFAKEIIVNLNEQISNMETLTIDKKKFVVIEQKEFNKIQLLAAQKSKPTKILSLRDGKKHAYNIIDKWAKGK